MQGLGAALVSPAALSIVTTTFAEGAERNKALGVWGAVAGSGGAAGVLLGGVLTKFAGWEWVLFVNVPIGLAAAALAPRLLRESRDASAQHFDVAGAVTVTAGPGAARLRAGRRQQRRLGLGADDRPGRASRSRCSRRSSLIERAAAHPLVPFSIFRLQTLRGSNIVALLIGMSLFSMFFFISLYMQQVLGYDALKAGLAYLPLAVSIIISAGIASQMVTRIGFKPALIAGLVFIAAGLLWFSQVSARRQLRRRRAVPVAAGRRRPRLRVRVGHDRRGRRRPSRDDAGLASGLINTSQQVGGALGLAILAAVANASTDNAVGVSRLVALNDGFRRHSWSARSSRSPARSSPPC